MKIRNYDERNGFGISYNPMTDKGEETAVVIEGGEYLILLGDYTNAYKGVKTIKQARKMFTKLQQEGAVVSPWSD